MKQRFYMFKRGRTFYFQDAETGEQKSLGTKDKAEAFRLLEIKRQSVTNPGFNHLMLKVCLSGNDQLLAKRTWMDVMNQMATHGKETTQVRCQRAMANKALDRIRHKKLVETTSDDLLAVLNDCCCSVNHFLRRFHNLAVGLGWLPLPILPPKFWPKPEFKDKRAITAKEHEAIIEAEKNPERKLYYEFLWETGAAQSDAASLTAEQIDWENGVLSFDRMKTGATSHLVIGKALKGILQKLAVKGPLFPHISTTSANDRAAEFSRRCRLLEIRGISLHSYRYAWAERAKKCGYPERFAQQALGHNSKAVHRFYAKNAVVAIPSIEQYERDQQAKAIKTADFNQAASSC